MLMPDSFNLNIPFVPLSTRVSRVGEIEKRFLTPFGTIDVVFRDLMSLSARSRYMEIEVEGDVECWASYTSEVPEFRTALLHFVWGMISGDHLIMEAGVSYRNIIIYVNGSEIDLPGSSCDFRI